MAEEIFKYIDPQTLLSYLDSIHDFKSHLGMVDRPNRLQGKSSDKLHYWRDFAFNILRTGMGGKPLDSYLLNGCHRVGIHPEELGMHLAKTYTGIGAPVEIRYEADNPGSFYTKLFDVLTKYKQHELIPIIADTEFCLSRDSNTLQEMNTKFAICKNMEMYSDPSRTAKRDFHSAEWIEVPGATRVYKDTTIGGLLDVTISGSTNSIKIEYSGGGKGYLTEQYKLADRILPNSIGNCKDAFSSLLRTGDFYHSPIDYCKMQRENTFVEEQSWGNTALLRSMAIHLMKKRHGDQFQVRSCLEAIRYEHGGRKLIFGGEKPCVFWSYDRLAIAFAILLGVPCVHQIPNKNVKVYLPLQKSQGGGACTRANVEYTATELGGNAATSKPIIDLINTSTECLKRYVDLHLEIDKVQYSPKYLINILKMKASAGITKSLFTEEFLYNYHWPHSQLYVKGDHEEATIAILNANENILFYSLNHHIFILRDNTFLRIYRMDDRSTVAAGAEIYSFTKFVLTEESLMPRNPFLKLLKKMKQVENYMVIFSDSRERFMAEDKGHFIEHGGYTSYEMVLFFNAAVELFGRIEDKMEFCRAFHGVFHTLNALGETQLSSELLLFLNTFSEFSDNSLGTEEAMPIIASIVTLTKAYSQEAHAAMESFGFNENNMIEYLDRHLPLGTFGRYCDHIESALQAYNAKPVAANTIVKPRRSRSRSRNRTVRKLNINL